ncbi:MAG: acyl dehydratase, partial [Candidatus Rokuibacteriota bacterium]
MCFEDLQVGDEYRSPGRTVTEADIVIFAGVSGDYNVLHTDAEYMKASLYGERIAHGLLGLSVQHGLLARSMPA